MYKLIFIFLIYLTIPFSGLAQKNCWTSYRADEALTGNTIADIASNYELKWTYSTDDNIKSSPIICGNNIYVGSNDGGLYCINTEGELKWKFQTETSFEAPPLLVKNTVYIGSLEGIMFAIDAKTGEELWRFVTDGQISGSANYIETKKRKQLVFGSYDYFLYSLDAITGKLIWKYETDNFINGFVRHKISMRLISISQFYRAAEIQ